MLEKYQFFKGSFNKCFEADKADPLDCILNWIPSKSHWRILLIMLDTLFSTIEANMFCDSRNSVWHVTTLNSRVFDIYIWCDINLNLWIYSLAKNLNLGSYMIQKKQCLLNIPLFKQHQKQQFLYSSNIKNKKDRIMRASQTDFGWRTFPKSQNVNLKQM